MKTSLLERLVGQERFGRIKSNLDALRNFCGLKPAYQVAEESKKHKNGKRNRLLQYCQFEDIGFVTMFYKGPSKEALMKFIEDDEKIERKIWDFEFEVRDKPVEEVLERYWLNRIILVYLADNYVNWEVAYIVMAPFIKDGTQAKRFIEFCLNYIKALPASITGYHTFEKIPFQIMEQKERRILNLITGADHPEIFWRERYTIYVEERKPQKTTAESEDN